MPPAEKHVLCVNDHIPDLTEEQAERLLDSLPSWRREAALRFRFPQGRLACAVGYVELLRGLRLRFGIEGCPSFCYNEHGKPFLPLYPDVHFSISHCKTAVGCLTSNRPCGLDIEHIRTAKPDLVNHTMNRQEAADIFNAPNPDVAFTRLWTRKEAVLKLLGTGLVDDLHHVLAPERTRDIFLQTTENLFKGYVLTTAFR